MSILVNCVYRIIQKVKKIIPKKLFRAVYQKATELTSRRIVALQVADPDPARYPFGVNLIADIKAETGLGQSSRLLAGLIDETRVTFSILYYDMKSGTESVEADWDGRISSEQKYLINIVHVNPSQMWKAYLKYGSNLWNGHYNIAYWLWEMEDFPDEWTCYFNLFDEIWTPSEFISNAVRTKTDKIVRTLPYFIQTPVDETADRKYFNLPEDKFLYLMMYDAGSVSERKNPFGVIEAYKRAFPAENPNVGIVLKMKSCEEKERVRIRKLLEGYENVYIIPGSFSKTKVNALIKCTDVLVSLHRAEGFGLPLAEAMNLGRPVVGTGYSANTEFMNDKVSCMVGYKKVALEKDMIPYRKGELWADPNIDEAAAYMRRLFEDRAFRDEMARNGMEYVKQVLGREQLTDRLSSFLDEIETKIK